MQLEEKPKPELYSPTVIYIFSILFSIVFGAVLFAMNLRRVGQKEAAMHVIIISVLWLLLGAFVIAAIGSRNPIWGLLINVAGAVVLNELAWDKFIGKTIYYEKRSWRKPVLIGLLISVPLILLMVMRGGA